MNGPNIVTGRGMRLASGLPSRGCLGRWGRGQEPLRPGLSPPGRDWNLWEGRPECCITVTLAVGRTGSGEGEVKWGDHLGGTWNSPDGDTGQSGVDSLLATSSSQCFAHEHTSTWPRTLHWLMPVCAPSQSAQEMVEDTHARWWAWQNMHYLITYKVEQYCDCSTKTLSTIPDNQFAKLLSRVWLFATPWTIVRQAPLSMGFSRQEYWSGLPCPPLGDLPDPGIKPVSLLTPTLADRFFTTSATWEARRQSVMN